MGVYDRRLWSLYSMSRMNTVSIPKRASNKCLISYPSDSVQLRQMSQYRVHTNAPNASLNQTYPVPFSGIPGCGAPTQTYAAGCMLGFPLLSVLNLSLSKLPGLSSRLPRGINAGKGVYNPAPTELSALIRLLLSTVDAFVCVWSSSMNVEPSVLTSGISIW